MMSSYFLFSAGLYSVAENLISLGVDLKATDIEGRTALHHASYHGKTDVIKLLIDAGCNKHAVSELISCIPRFQTRWETNQFMCM